MRRWTRANTATLCGHCAARLEEGAAVQLVKVGDVKRELVRGVCCAGPAPPDLPTRLVLRQTTKKFKPLDTSKLVAAVTQNNAAQLRERMPYRESREPGEDE